MTGRGTLLIWLAVVASIAAAVVVVARLDLIPGSSAQTAVPAANSAPLEGPVEAATFRRIAEAQTPMVVNIRTESRRQTRDVREFFFFGPELGPRGPREEILEGAGSGFIVDANGLVLTNHHVVEGASRIEVALFASSDDPGGDVTYDAKVIGTDPLTDSALLQLTETPDVALPAATFGDSDRMAPGDWVMAIGNPFNLAHTVTVGVISAKDRPFRPVAGRVQEFLQTDAAINPGNSGGPLLNLRGEVIGINTAIFSTTANGGNMGIGFAVPMNAVRELLPALREGRVTRGQIGVQITAVPREGFDRLGLSEPVGALVAAVDTGGPAARAGLQPGDVIVGYNGERIETPDELVDLVVRTKPGTNVAVEIARGTDRERLTMTVQELQFGDASGGGQAPSGAAQTFGLSLSPLTPDLARQLNLPSGAPGVVVTAVEPRSPAARGGVHPGDLILEVNRRPVRSMHDVAGALEGTTGPAFLLVQRGSQRVFLTLTK
jgi:serine protease Do